MIMMMSIRGDFMRDNQPKMSEAAAASLRSGEVETGRGWRMLNTEQWQDGHQLPRSDNHVSMPPCLCSLCSVLCANLGPPAAWRRAVAEIFIFHFSLSPARQAAAQLTATRRRAEAR